MFDQIDCGIVIATLARQFKFVYITSPSLVLTTIKEQLAKNELYSKVKKQVQMSEQLEYLTNDLPNYQINYNRENKVGDFDSDGVESVQNNDEDFLNFGCLPDSNQVMVLDKFLPSAPTTIANIVFLEKTTFGLFSDVAAGVEEVSRTDIDIVNGLRHFYLYFLINGLDDKESYEFPTPAEAEVYIIRWDADKVCLQVSFLVTSLSDGHNFTVSLHCTLNSVSEDIYHNTSRIRMYMSIKFTQQRPVGTEQFENRFRSWYEHAFERLKLNLEIENDQAKVREQMSDSIFESAIDFSKQFWMFLLVPLGYRLRYHILSLVFLGLAIILVHVCASSLPVLKISSVHGGSLKPDLVTLNYLNSFASNRKMKSFRSPESLTSIKNRMNRLKIFHRRIRLFKRSNKCFY